MTMKVGSSLAAFTLFGKSIAISLSSDASVESHISVHDLQEPPSDDCCFLYDQMDYNGNQDWICVDTSDAGHGIHSMHIDYNGNSIKSWRCGKNTHIVFCDIAGPQWVEGTGYTCADGWDMSSAGRVDNPVTNFIAANDQYWKSAGVQAYDQNHGGPIKFSDVRSDGTCIGGTRLMPATDSAQGTEYTNLEGYWHGIMVPYGYSASVYHDTHYTDLQKEYIAEIIDLEGRMKCQSWKCDQNECPGSVIVHRHANQGSFGYWKLIGSSQFQETFKYTAGFKNENTQTTTQADQITMSNSMEFDLTFQNDEDEKYQLTTYYSQKTIQEAMNIMTTMTNGTTESMTYTCAPYTARSGVQLYQWVIESGPLSIQDPTVVCIYNLDINAGPKCPLAACSSLGCTECNPAWNGGKAD